MKEFKINIDDTYFNVIQFGDGAKNMTLISGVTVTGLEGSGIMVSAAYEKFHKDFTVTLVERRKVLPEGFTLADMTNDVYRVLTELGIKKTSIVGFSQGGMIAMKLAAEHPELVEKLVVGSSSAKPCEENNNTVHRWVSLAEAGDVVEMNRQMIHDVYSDEYTEKYAPAFRAMEKIGSEADRKRFAILCKAVVDTDLTAELEKIKCKTLVTGALGDRIFNKDSWDLIAEKIEGAEEHIVEGYSHAVYDEAPEFKDILFDFLTK